MLNDELANAGFSPKKAALYIALLKLGRGSAAKLADASGIKRTTVYDLMDELIRDNMASVTFDGNKRIFAVEPPENLEALMRKKMDNVERIMPGLKEIFRQNTSRPRVRYFEGIEGIRYVHDELLKVKTKEYFYFGSISCFVDTLGNEYLENFVRRRISRKIWSNAIRIRSHEIDRDCAAPGERNYRRVRYLSKSIPSDVANLILFDGHIAICATSKENYAMIIESSEMFTILKLLWDCMWAVSEE